MTKRIVFALIVVLALLGTAHVASSYPGCRVCLANDNCASVEIGFTFCNQDPEGDCWASGWCSSGSAATYF